MGPWDWVLVEGLPATGPEGSREGGWIPLCTAEEVEEAGLQVKIRILD